MIPLSIHDETAPLEAVILGTPESMGPVPLVDQTYDPQSRQQVIAGTFPKEADLVSEMEAFSRILKDHGVAVYRPEVMESYNQVFARDIAFVVGSEMIVPKVTEGRMHESGGIQYLTDQMKGVVHSDDTLPMEGGDILLWQDHLFVGISDAPTFDKYTVARTHQKSLDFLKAHFPERKVRGFELVKSDLDPLQNVLHLDCCFQPIGMNKALLYPEGFKHAADVDFIKQLFGKKNVFEISQSEAAQLQTNVFSIDPTTIVTDLRFERLNDQLRAWGLTAIGINYAEVRKMGGAFRCTTLPLRRRYE